MKWAITLTVLGLLLFGPLIVWVAERTRNRWLKPVSYLCIGLGPALAVLGGLNYSHMKKRMASVNYPGRETQEKYLGIYAIIQEADRLQAKGEYPKAQEKFQTAWQLLQALQRENPGWEPTIVKYRLRYCQTKLGELQALIPAKSAASPP